MAQLILQNISKTYASSQASRKILDEISLTVKTGEFVVLLGPSGCGKTTLLKVIAGLVKPDDGDYVLTIDGRAITEPGPERNIVFQNYTSFPWLTVLENVRFSLQFGNMPLAEQNSRAEEYVRLVKLWDYRDEYPRVLSGGQQQRVAIARTLAARPSVILMDEPFAALDAQTREDMQSELLQLREKEGCTIVFVTHDIAEAAFLGDRVLILSKIPARVVEAINTKSGGDLIGGNVDLEPLAGLVDEEFLEGRSERAEKYRYSDHYLDLQRTLKKKLSRSSGVPRD
jgi:NitT/TauT family transport system ATP-binding protein